VCFQSSARSWRCPTFSCIWRRRAATIVSRSTALTRHPDVLFYRHDHAVAELNSCVQRRGVFAVELKSRMSKRHMDEATVELLRDYAHTVDAGVSRTAPTFFALMGDGVEWVATCWRCVVDGYSKAFASGAIGAVSAGCDRCRYGSSVCGEHRPSAHGRDGVTDKPTGWDLAPLDVAGELIIADRVLAATSACVVVQCGDATGTTFALKVPRPSQPARCEKEMAVRSKWLADGLVPPNIAVCSAVTFFGASAMRLDTVGTVLERVCLCSSAERAKDGGKDCASRSQRGTQLAALRAPPPLSISIRAM
jgi:hypothetical protein